jgi:phosphatidyl-myo-inositol dimannoside synthase
MLNNEYPPIGGGTGTVNKEILERLALHSNYKIDLVTGSNEKKRRTVELTPDIRIIYIPLNCRNIHHASNSALIKFAFFGFFLAFKLQRKNRYDFSFSWSTIPAGFISWLLYLFFRLPYIVRVGGPDIPGFEKRYKNIYRIISPLIKLIWKKSKYLITKCKIEKEMVSAINDKLDLQVIYNGVDTEKFRPEKRAINQHLKIICVARLIQRKGQDILIRSIAHLQEKGITFNVDLVGDGDETDNYKLLAKKLKVLQQINFKGYISRETMESEYQYADIFVLPSYNEGMSNSLLEAMACGLPVVVTKVGGTSELVVDGENGYAFPTGDEEKLYLILEKIAMEPASLNEMGEKSRRIAESLNWENIVNQYDTLFKSINQNS